MKKFYCITAALLIIATSVYAADCEKALFGWSLKSGHHIGGTLSNEGVSARNPRGFQASKKDTGNFRNGVFCGGTAFGWSCKALPKKIDVRKLTREQAIQLYHDNQWQEILGNEWQGQYLPYKVFDVGVNCGSGSAALCLVDTINELNGIATDFSRRPVITHAMVEWVNSYTRSDTLPPDYKPKYLGDIGQPNGTDSTRRKLFITTFEKKVAEHYGDIIAHNPKLAVWWQTWKRRLNTDE